MIQNSQFVGLKKRGVDIRIDADGTELYGNKFGVNQAVTEIIWNTENGIYIDQADNTIIGSVENPNYICGDGIGHGGVHLANANGTQIIGNYIGTNENYDDLRNKGSGVEVTYLSADTYVEGNVLGYNLEYGIEIRSTANTSSTVVNANTIVGNLDGGVYVSSSSNNIVSNNYIGTNVDGDLGLGNANHGILIDSPVDNSEIINNTIAYNGTTDEHYGIKVAETSSLNYWEGNSIYLNGDQTLNSKAIDFDDNTQENVEVVTLVSYNAITNTIVFNLSADASYVEFYLDSLNQALELIATSTTDLGTGENTYQLSEDELAAMEAGFGNGLSNLTAIATYESGTSSVSSEVSSSLELCLTPLMVTSISDDGSCGTLRHAVDFANINAGADIITFDPLLDGGVITLGSVLELTGGETSIDGDFEDDGIPNIQLTGDESLVAMRVTSSDNVINGLSFVNVALALSINSCLLYTSDAADD